MTNTTNRLEVDGALDEKLFFAQVREDPAVELHALDIRSTDKVVIVSSGGCTALSLLAAGAAEVVGVDVNRTQNHLVELKIAAAKSLEQKRLVEFLGGWSASQSGRLSTYAGLREDLTPQARSYWDADKPMIRRGVLNQGVSEKFVKIVISVVRAGIHRKSRIDRMLAAQTLDEQQRIYNSEWNSRRWRWLFKLLLNRAVFRKAYDPVFFQHVTNPSFSDHFYKLMERMLTRVPVSTNYFLSHMLTGRYPQRNDGLPPYLQTKGLEVVAGASDKVTLVDGTYGGYLKGQPDESIDVFALSNICEWFTPGGIDDLFGEIVRTAKPEARLVFRNFVGWNEVPEKWRNQITEDKARGESLIEGDRSGLQARVAVCRIAK